MALFRSIAGERAWLPHQNTPGSVARERRTSRGPPEGCARAACFSWGIPNTSHAEFLYACVEKTINEDLPRETEFLRRYDRFRDQI